MENKKGFNKLSLIIVITIIMTIIGISIFFIVRPYKLSEEEQFTAKVVKKYHDSLKNPNSMEIFEIRLYDTPKKDGQLVFMDASGQNGFGGMTRNIVAYNNEMGYMGDDSEADKTITKYTTNVYEILMSKGIHEKWNSDEEYISIDVQKILKNFEKVK